MPQQPQIDGPPCLCSQPTAQRTVCKEGPNKRRPYASCPTRKCQFFQWMDEENGAGPMGVATPQRGGKSSGRDVSSDVCYKCGMTGHWASNCPNEGGAGKGPGRGKGGGHKGR